MEKLVPIFCLVTGWFIIGGLSLLNHWQFGVKISKALKNLFIFLSLLCLLIIGLAIFDVYFRGYWTTKIFIWIFLFVAGLSFAFGNRKIFTGPWRIFAGVLFYLPVFSILLIVIPSIITILSLNLWLSITGNEKAIYYNDKEIRIQKACADCDPGFRGYPQYFSKKGIFEFRKGILDNGNNLFDDRIRVEKEKNKVVVYLYYTNSEPVPFTFER